MLDEQKDFDEIKHTFEKDLYNAKKLLNAYVNVRRMMPELKNAYENLRAYVEAVEYDKESDAPSNAFLRKPYYDSDNAFVIIENGGNITLPIVKDYPRFLTRILDPIQKLLNLVRYGKEKIEDYEKTITDTLSDLEYSVQRLSNQYDVVTEIEKKMRKRQIPRESDKIKDIGQLDVPPSGNIINTEKAAPGILDDYRSWGIDRVCLDGFQNHLPADSGGQACYLHFLVDDEWLTRDEVLERQAESKVKEIRFADDGVGFTPDNLKYLHSTKHGEMDSAGQFGEGMKILSMAAVNYGLDLEFWSRNWKAKARGEELGITNTRNNDEIEQRKKLVFEIEQYDGEPIVGSRTIFKSPTPGMINYALQLPELVLPLGNNPPVFQTKGREITDIENGGNCYVKGIFLRNINSFFSYDFDTANINPDRNDFNSSFNIPYEIASIMRQVGDKNIIKTFMVKVIHYLEEQKEKAYYFDYDSEVPVEITAVFHLKDYVNSNKRMKQLWMEAFNEACNELYEDDGRTIVIGSGSQSQIPDDLMEEIKKKYRFIDIKNDRWRDLFEEIGVPTDKTVIPKQLEKVIQTSLTIDYASSLWSEQRILLDACQNHLPQDSGGTYIKIRFKTKDGRWHDILELSSFNDEDVAAIKISDNGRGYDTKNLELFASNKDSGSVGKWGEGLKIISAAAVRLGYKMELRSRDWMAVPMIQTEVINEGHANEKKVDRLVYKVNRNLKGQSFEDGDTIQDEMSSTTFLNLKPELIKQFREIEDNVLFINPPRPILKANNLDVISTTGGKVFVKDLLLPGAHCTKYTYNLKDFDIETRDRDSIDIKKISLEIEKVLENTTNEEFISQFLDDCISSISKMDGKLNAEFLTDFYIRPESENADVWIKVFKQKFGERAAIRSVNSLDMNDVHKAEHVGLSIITLPDTVARALTGLKGRDGNSISSYKQSVDEMIKNAIPVDEAELTEKEREVLEFLKKFNLIFALHDRIYHPIKHIKVYDYSKDYVGTRAAGFAGYGDTINISRETLNKGRVYAGDVCFHENTHAQTGEEDPAAGFRNYNTRLLSIVAPSVLGKSILDASFLQEVSVDAGERILAQLLTTDSFEDVGEFVLLWKELKEMRNHTTRSY